MATFGTRLRGLRESKNWNQGDLADQLDISRSAVGMYERDEREPNFQLLDRIADLFGVTTDYLVCRSSKPTLTQSQEREELSLQALKDIRDALRRGERGDIPEEEADRLADYLDFRIERIEKESEEQK